MFLFRVKSQGFLFLFSCFLLLILFFKRHFIIKENTDSEKPHKTNVQPNALL